MYTEYQNTELKDCFNVAYAAVLYVNDQVAKTVKQLFIKIPLLQKPVRRRNPGRVPGLVTRCRSCGCRLPLLQHPAAAIGLLRHAITNIPDCKFPFKKYQEEGDSRFLRKVRQISNRLHVVIIRKTSLFFRFTAVRPLNGIQK